MNIKKIVWLYLFIAPARASADPLTLAEQLNKTGYAPITNHHHDSCAFDSLYDCFDELIEFLHAHPAHAHKLYSAKERFIRSKQKDFYATDFFGFYDESGLGIKDQIAFYYAIHFHEFLINHYPEFTQVPEISRFLDACHEMHQTCSEIFLQAAHQLGLESLFSSAYAQPPIIIKVIKYLPSYTARKPHYDGTALSLFMHSTDDASLLLCAYDRSSSYDYFFSPPRADRAMILIPGALLTEFSISPTPHVVINSGNTRYSTVAFAMRPYYTGTTSPLKPLPTFNY